MFRTGHTITLKKGQTVTLERSLKNSEQIKKLQHKMQMIDFILQHSQNRTDAQIVADSQEYERLAREIQKLSQPKCHKVQKRYKKMPPEKIRAFVLKKIEEAKQAGVLWIMVEDIADELQVKPHFVKQVFQKLNAEGILHQPIKRIPHDSNRDPMCGGSYSGWMSNLYPIRNKELEDDE